MNKKNPTTYVPFVPSTVWDGEREEPTLDLRMSWADIGKQIKENK